MAAAEARAAWQRAANRCLVQEDAKRAPKLACCQSSSTPQHDTNCGNPTNSEDHPIHGFMPLNWNPLNSNLPPDTKWWLQLQPNFGYHRDLLCEELNCLQGETREKKVEPQLQMSRFSGEPLLGETINVNPKKSEDIFEPPWIVSSVFMKHCSDTGFEDLKILTGYSKESLKCRGHVGKNQNQERDLFSSGPMISKLEKASCKVDSPWEEGGTPQPWWRVAHEEELASLVAERAMQHIENCDLPRPTQTVHICAAQLPSLDSVNSAFCSPPVGKVTPLGLCDPVFDTYISGTTTETKSYPGGGRPQHQEDYPYSGAQGCRQTRNSTPKCEPAYENDSSRAQLLQALRHSQTRAREAEVAAKKAYDEKDHIVKLLFRQASYLFAHKQWLKMLQLENICLQLKIKENQIAAFLPDLPWMPLKEKPGRKNATRRNEKKQKGGICNAVIFAVGLGLVGAGLLLGWTLGWLLPKKQM